MVLTFILSAIATASPTPTPAAVSAAAERIGLASTAVVAVATVVLVVLTAWYARVNARMLAAMRESREPCVILDLELPNPSDLRFVVSNIGQGVARNVRFTVLNDIEWVRGWRGESAGISSLPVVRNGISYLAPGRSLRFSVDGITPSKTEEFCGALRVVVRYETETGKELTREVTIEGDLYSAIRFDSYRDSGWLVAEGLRDLQRGFERERNPLGFAGLRVRNLVLGNIACPVCGESISKRARKCPRCHEFLVVAESEPPVGPTAPEAPPEK